MSDAALSFFSSQFEFSEVSGAQFEYMTKDTARVAGVDWQLLMASDNGRDRLKDMGAQTRNGVSVRNLMSILAYAKALAYFRGNTAVEVDDVRQVLPFVLQDKLQPDHDAPFFALPENAAYRSDRISWLRYLFDQANLEFNRLELDEHDSVAELELEFGKGLDGLNEKTIRQRLSGIERLIKEKLAGKKMYGHLYDDVLKLKYLHQRYTNYHHWLKSQ